MTSAIDQPIVRVQGPNHERGLFALSSALEFFFACEATSCMHWECDLGYLVIPSTSLLKAVC